MNPFSWCPRFLSFFFSPGFKPELQKFKAPLTILGSLVVIILTTFGFHHLLATGALNPDPGSLDFEMAMQARVTHAKLWVALVLVPLVPFVSIIEWQFLDRTRLWTRLIHWTELDHEAGEAAKVSGACLIFGVLLLGNYILFSSVLK